MEGMTVKKKNVTGWNVKGRTVRTMSRAKGLGYSTVKEKLDTYKEGPQGMKSLRGKPRFNIGDKIDIFEPFYLKDGKTYSEYLKSRYTNVKHGVILEFPDENERFDVKMPNSTILAPKQLFEFSGNSRDYHWVPLIDDCYKLEHKTGSIYWKKKYREYLVGVEIEDEDDNEEEWVIESNIERTIESNIETNAAANKITNMIRIKAARQRRKMFKEIQKKSNLNDDVTGTVREFLYGKGRYGGKKVNQRRTHRKKNQR